MSNLFIGIGIIFIIIGILWKYGLLSWFGHLPGDISYTGDNFSFFMPITSMLLISMILSIIMWIANRVL